MTKMPDPARYVDEFEKKVADFRKWHCKWKYYGRTGGAVPGDDFYLPRSAIADKWLTEAGELLQSQKDVNVMMLAAIDGLKRRVKELESK